MWSDRGVTCRNGLMAEGHGMPRSSRWRAWGFGSAKTNGESEDLAKARNAVEPTASRQRRPRKSFPGRSPRLPAFGTDSVPTPRSRGGAQNLPERESRWS